MKPTFWLLCCLLWCVDAAFAQDKTLGTAKLPAGTEKRAAVIFANQDYTDPRYDLQKTHNDADDMRFVLEGMGFKVMVFKKDLNERSFAREIQALRDTLRGFQVVFFYYSGHGAEYRGENYLIPTDVSLVYNADIESQGIKLSTVYEALQDAGVKTSIVALDACRSLPIGNGKGNLPNGLIIPNTNPAGTYTMYATRAGKIAKENLNGRNSYFTQELKKYLPLPNLTLNQIHYQTRRGVKQATKNEQEPGIANELDGEFTFLLKELPPPVDPEKEALKAEIERYKKAQTDLKNAKADLPPLMPMVAIPGGTFDMGSNEGEEDEKPIHTVTVSGFYMGKYEVTVAQFAQFVAATNYQTDAEKAGSSRLWDSGKNVFYDSTGIHWRCGADGSRRPAADYNHPVLHVSYNDAVAFCAWLSKTENKPYRLPTEAEWEYAAGNGPTHAKYSWGNSDTSGQEGNVADESFKKKFNYQIFTGYTDGYIYTAPVGSFKPNKLGLHDMTGNVFEWCSDWYDKSYYAVSSSSNPTGPTTGTYRVLRGGSWYSTPYYARVAFRNNSAPDHRNYGVGFRVVSPSQ
ncbi:MAG: SUMF1/EgtB/PvdO family nonheme iron enzyme [Spirosomataceae bacterium]